ncbi:MAG: DUF1553 domain-containing protein [Acidobacteria bacterium]|nr:DUF1553 domain-containing protein [Acidobacteriota bacterium]
MRYVRWFLVGCLALVGAPVRALDFGRDVQPLLSDRCYACHGPDAANRQAGLRLDQLEAVLRPAASGKVPVTPGDPSASELLRRVETADASQRMPPAYLGHDALKPGEIDLLRQWIAQGAPFERHWSFVPPQRPEIPAVSQPAWAKQPFDAFVLARLDAEGLAPSPEADPAVWLRRMSLDLLGLPPTPAEIDAFLQNVERDGEAAYAKAVDRALASPRYGERMAMDWLDVARYADTHGFNNDSAREMWRWRDWVIAAFNRNLPYDRFLTEQLAGDLLPHPTLEQRIATGFNRNHVINSEGGIIDEEYRVEYVVDRVRTLGMAWVGLSIECARCHDHKFDPISQKDYYRFYAFFNNVPEIGEAGRVANAVPMIPAPTQEQQERMAALERRIAERTRARKPVERDAPPLVTPEPPTEAALRLDCATGDGGKGIDGSACGAGATEKPEEPVKLEKSGAFTLSLWARADQAQPDAPLFSASDYEPAEASAKHGQGVELRIAGSEVELRLAKRFPSYSITVRSEGAGIEPGQWRHVAAVYEGSEGKDSMRAEAAWVRLFVDGREVATRVLNDDMASGVTRLDSPYRLGWDNSREGRRFAGSLDRLAVWRRALTRDEVRREFQSAALPWAQAHSDAPLAHDWLQRAAAPDEELEGLRAELFALRRNLPTAMVMQEMETPRESHVLLRGMYDAPGDAVQPGVPEDLLGPWPAGAPKNRLGLAQWLTRPDHPTTARVVVNRFWQQLFGLGLVKSAGDFGLQGDPPSHPELLDWLATDFVANGWDVKRLMKSLVLSATYRQDSAISPELRAKDPENRLLARGPRFRLPAEVIRDQALAVSGLLSDRVGGPSVHPYQPKGLYDGVVVGAAYPGTTWVESEGEDLYRRSLYTFWKRTLPYPAMTVFDAPDREFCTVQRSTTNTPLQALTLMNDPTFVEASRKLAERALREGGEETAGRIALAFRLATGRNPDAAEATLLRQSFDELLRSFEDSDEAGALLEVGASPADGSVPPKVLAAYTALASMILNLDEVITKG